MVYGCVMRKRRRMEKRSESCLRSPDHSGTRGQQKKRWAEIIHQGLDRGVHPPEPMMHLPLFQISPLFQKIFQSMSKKFQISIFREKFLFYPPKFLMTFFIHWLKIRTSPYFSALFTHFPSVSEIINFPPTFQNVLLFSFNFCVFPSFRWFFFPPSFDHDACIYTSYNTCTGRPCTWSLSGWRKENIGNIEKRGKESINRSLFQSKTPVYK